MILIRGLTVAEQQVINQLGDAANLATSLPVLHVNDNAEFFQHIHALQNIIYARPAYQAAKEAE